MALALNCAVQAAGRSNRADAQVVGHVAEAVNEHVFKPVGSKDAAGSIAVQGNRVLNISVAALSFAAAIRAALHVV